MVIGIESDREERNGEAAASNVGWAELEVEAIVVSLRERREQASWNVSMQKE